MSDTTLRQAIGVLAANPMCALENGRSAASVLAADAPGTPARRAGNSVESATHPGQSAVGLAGLPDIERALNDFGCHYVCHEDEKSDDREVPWQWDEADLAGNRAEVG